MNQVIPGRFVHGDPPRRDNAGAVVWPTGGIPRATTTSPGQALRRAHRRLGREALHRLDHELHRAKVVWPSHSLVDHYVELRSWCVKNGHGRGHKDW